MKNPKPGTWKAVVADFAACGTWSGRVLFEGATAFITSGAADTWSNWSKKPTGWAFTNVSGYGNGIDMSNEAGGTDSITLDVLNLSKAKDVSPGFVTGATNKAGGTSGVSLGKANKLVVPVFSNGGKKPGKVLVTVREGSAKGRVVASKTVKLEAFQRKAFEVPLHAEERGPGPSGRHGRPGEQGQGEVRAQPEPGHHAVGRSGQAEGPDRRRRPGAGARAGDRRRSGLAGHPVRDRGQPPEAKVMKKYAAVIWESAVDRGEGQLDAKDRAEVTKFLNKGGKFLLTSNRIFDALSADHAGGRRVRGSLPRRAHPGGQRDVRRQPAERRHGHRSRAPGQEEARR